MRGWRDQSALARQQVEGLEVEGKAVLERRSSGSACAVVEPLTSVQGDYSSELFLGRLQATDAGSDPPRWRDSWDRPLHVTCANPRRGLTDTLRPGEWVSSTEKAVGHPQALDALGDGIFRYVVLISTAWAEEDLPLALPSPWPATLRRRESYQLTFQFINGPPYEWK